MVGPVISAAQRDRVEAIIAAGVAAGGKLVAGGHRPSHLERGYFVEPTVLVVDDNRNPVAQQEVFGPVVSVQGYRDLDHAIAISNGTPYGLSSAVCTNRLDVITRLVRELNVGTVNVREVPGYRLELTPFGGIKDSGLGYKEGVWEAMKSFTNVRTYSLPWPA